VIFDPINLRLLRLSHSDRHLRPSNAPNQLIQRGFRNPSAKSGTDIPQPRQEGGRTTLPDEGDTMQMDTQLLLSVEEAADVIGLGRTRTYELVMAKKIQSVKVGRRRLVVQSSLLDFVQTLLLEQDCA
jgi:excisionase family DNA binding protein